MLRGSWKKKKVTTITTREAIPGTRGKVLRPREAGVSRNQDKTSLPGQTDLDPEQHAALVDELTDGPPRLEKEEVNYRFQSTPEESCGRCVHFQPPGKCEVVHGLVRSVDVCDAFEPASTPKITPRQQKLPVIPEKASEAAKRAFTESYDGEIHSKDVMEPWGSNKGAPGGHVTTDQLVKSGWGFKVGKDGKATEDETATLPRAKNQADQNFSKNERETIMSAHDALLRGGWELEEENENVSVFRHKSLPHHVLAVSGNQRWEHRDCSRLDEQVVGRGKMDKLAEYARTIPQALKTLEAQVAFNQRYRD